MVRRLLRLLRVIPREQPRSVPSHVERHDDAGDPLDVTAQRAAPRQGISGAEAVPNQFPGYGGGDAGGAD
jgi:hypothetical protein